MISGESPGHLYCNVFALIVLGMKICVRVGCGQLYWSIAWLPQVKLLFPRGENSPDVPMAMCASPFGGKYGIACVCRFR